MVTRASKPSASARPQALDCVVEDRLHLLARDAGEPRQEVVYRGPAFEVLEEREDGDAGAAEDPGAADLLRVTLDRRA